MKNEIEQYFQPGDIMAYCNEPDNAPHHVTPFGWLIHTAQSLIPYFNPRYTHVALVQGFDDEVPEMGYTDLKILDTLTDQTVEYRGHTRDYACDVYRLKSDLILPHDVKPRVLQQKAMEIARSFIGLPYEKQTLKELFKFRYWREAAEHNEFYTRWLIDRFDVDLDKRTYAIKKEERMICPEVIMCSYQLAWLLLAGREVADEPMPRCLQVHAHSTPARLVEFFEISGFFEKVSHQHIDALRFRGSKHPKDREQPEKVIRTLTYQYESTPTRFERLLGDEALRENPQHRPECEEEIEKVREEKTNARL